MRGVREREGGREREKEREIESLHAPEAAAARGGDAVHVPLHCCPQPLEGRPAVGAPDLRLEHLPPPLS